MLEVVAIDLCNHRIQDQHLLELDQQWQIAKVVQLASTLRLRSSSNADVSSFVTAAKDLYTKIGHLSEIRGPLTPIQKGHQVAKA